ncbi:hypothetical protein FF1_007108 [Malus domestica]
MNMRVDYWFIWSARDYVAGLRPPLGVGNVPCRSFNVVYSSMQAFSSVRNFQLGFKYQTKEMLPRRNPSDLPLVSWVHGPPIELVA